MAAILFSCVFGQYPFKGVNNEEIKQAISEGSFQINPEVVADRLLETVKELIHSKKGAA